MSAEELAGHSPSLARCLIPRTCTVKERTNFFKLSSDLHMHAMACTRVYRTCMHSYTGTHITRMETNLTKPTGSGKMAQWIQRLLIIMATGLLHAPHFSRSTHIFFLKKRKARFQFTQLYSFCKATSQRVPKNLNLIKLNKSMPGNADGDFYT